MTATDTGTSASRERAGSIAEAGVAQRRESVIVSENRLESTRDTLVKLSRRNAWLRSVVGKSATEPEDARLGVFILRREALTRGGVPRAKELIAGHGFRIVETLVLNPEEAERAARNIRRGSSAKEISGSRGVASRRWARSTAPPKGSTSRRLSRTERSRAPDGGSTVWATCG